MLRLVLAVMLLLIPFGLSSCDKAYMATMEKMGYAKRDILSSRVKSARDAQEDAKKEIQSTLEQFGKVVSYEGGDLEATYKKLNGELEDKRRQRQIGPETDLRTSKAWPMRSFRSGKKNLVNTQAPTCAGRVRPNSPRPRAATERCSRR